MYPRNAEFTKHCENLAAVKKSLVQIERAHKDAIRDNDLPLVETLQRMHFMLLGILAEATLRKITVDPIGFNDREREIIWRAGSQLNRWLESVELAARRHYVVPIHKDVDETSIGISEFDRYREIRTLLEGDLRPVIEDRNGIVHGQWVWRLKSGKENEFRTDKPSTTPNYCSLRSQKNLIITIGEIVHLFAVSEPAFDRDYLSLVLRITAAKRDLGGTSYAAWAKQLRSSRVPRTHS
jgi:hypothetical protein